MGPILVPRAIAQSPASGGKAAFQPQHVVGGMTDILKQMGVDVEPQRDNKALLELAGFVSTSMKSMAGIAEVLAGIIMGMEGSGGSQHPPSVGDLTDHVRFTRQQLG